jgi:dihydroorotase
MDVAIKGDKIAAVAANIPASDGRGVYDAGGRIVTAGLIDVHGHVATASPPPSKPTSSASPKGTTTIVDAGSAGRRISQAFGNA